MEGGYSALPIELRVQSGGPGWIRTNISRLQAEVTPSLSPIRLKRGINQNRVKLEDWPDYPTGPLMGLPGFEPGSSLLYSEVTLFFVLARLMY